MDVNPQSAHSQRRASGRKDMTSQRIRQGAARERRIREPRRQPQDARTVRAGLQHLVHRFGHSVRNGGVVPEGGALVVLDEIQACGGHRWEDGRNRIGAPPPINFASSQTHIPVAKNSIRWYKLAGSPIGGLPSAGGVFPGFLCIRGADCLLAA